MREACHFDPGRRSSLVKCLSGQRLEKIVPTMGDRVFNLISNYDPREFRKTMDEMAPLLPGKK